MFDLSTPDGLKAACEEAERTQAQTYSEWREQIYELLKYVKEASLEERESKEFHEKIWNSNAISDIDGDWGKIDLSPVIIEPNARKTLVKISINPLPNNREEKIASLNKIRKDIIDELRNYKIKAPAKTNRIMAALFPTEFTTLIVDGKRKNKIKHDIQKLRQEMGVKLGKTSFIGQHRQVLDRLEKVLGPVPDGDLRSLANRMTLPEMLLNLTNEDKEKSKINSTNQSAQTPSAPATTDQTTSEMKTTNAQNIILYGPPGTGKTYTIRQRAIELILGEKAPKNPSTQELTNLFLEYQKSGHIEFVTFHQSYGYEEFIEGLRPILKDDNQEIRYELHDGIFKRVALRALKAKGQVMQDQESPEANPTEYVLVIDEINRGNVSKILGELITLLEPDKRLGAENELRLPLAYSPESPSRFGVPSNLHILGTMNTADRSIALMDAALRRRFTFEEVMPDKDCLQRILKGALGDGSPLAQLVVDLFEVLNKRIRFLYDRDHQIGHAYFLRVKSLDDLRFVFAKRVIPLLQEYFYGDWNKICMVLGCPYSDAGKPLSSKNPHPIIQADTFSETDTLGFDHDDYEDRVDFSIAPAFQNTEREMNKDNLVRAFLGVLQLKQEDFDERLMKLMDNEAPPDKEGGDEETGEEDS